MTENGLFGIDVNTATDASVVLFLKLQLVVINSFILGPT